jgi:hypothetical protein
MPSGDPLRVVAGRQAVDAGRVRADEPDPGPSLILELVRVEAFRASQFLGSRGEAASAVLQESARDSQASGHTEHESVVGGRRWTRTSGLLHVEHLGLSAVLRAWRAERKPVSYTVTDHAGLRAVGTALASPAGDGAVLATIPIVGPARVGLGTPNGLSGRSPGTLRSAAQEDLNLPVPPLGSLFRIPS